MPTDLKALSSSVVSFGSQIQDLSATVDTLKESNARVQDAQATMQQNITSIKVYKQIVYATLFITSKVEFFKLFVSSFVSFFLLQNTVTELSNITQKPQMLTTNETKIKTDQLNAAIVHLSHNLTNINETLSRTVQWVAEDQKKDHVNIWEYT